MLDIEILRVIWWVLLGFLLIGFAITDGFDFGVAMLLPLVTRNEHERSLVLLTIKPIWEGNQVWIILGAGAIFAAWPFVYAVAFSGFYFLILLLLLTMGISRPVSFKYRNKLANPVWRKTWDIMVFVGGFFPAVIFGILIGNVLQGLPFYFDNSLRIFYSGDFFDLFNFFGIWCGLTSVFMLIMHGGLYLALKTLPPIESRAINFSKKAAVLVILFFVGGGFWIAYGLYGYKVTSQINPYGFSNPLHKEVLSSLGAWMSNYQQYPITIFIPSLAILSTVLVYITASLHKLKFAFFFSSLSLTGIIGTVGVSLFPFLLPSSTNFSSSLLIWDASSSALTLLLMLIAVLIFMPIIIFYTSWVYHVLSGKITEQDIVQNKEI